MFASLSPSRATTGCSLNTDSKNKLKKKDILVLRAMHSFSKKIFSLCQSRSIGALRGSSIKHVK